jgi:hypothetical protein
MNSVSLTIGKKTWHINVVNKDAINSMVKFCKSNLPLHNPEVAGPGLIFLILGVYILPSSQLISREYKLA